MLLADVNLRARFWIHSLAEHRLCCVTSLSKATSPPDAGSSHFQYHFSSLTCLPTWPQHLYKHLGIHQNEQRPTMLENNKFCHSLLWEMWQQVISITIDRHIRNATKSSTVFSIWHFSDSCQAQSSAISFFTFFFLHFYLHASPFLLCCSFLFLTCYKVIALSN